MLRHHDQNPRFDHGVVYGPLHREPFADSGEFLGQISLIGRSLRREAHAHKEVLVRLIAKLRAIDNITIMRHQEIRDRGNDTHPIGARQREHKTTHASPLFMMERNEFGFSERNLANFAGRGDLARV
jgi:hypothetical protein